MGALYGLGIDNLLVETNSQELPILDGSAKSLLYNDQVKELYLGISKKGRKNFRDVLKEEEISKKKIKKKNN